MPAPDPAPVWTSTVCPSLASNATIAGVAPTRFSCSLISLGMPMIMRLRLESGAAGGVLRPGKAAEYTAGSSAPRVRFGLPAQQHRGGEARPFGGRHAVLHEEADLQRRAAQLQLGRRRLEHARLVREPAADAFARVAR